MTTAPSEPEIDLQRLLAFVRRRGVVVVVIALISGGVAYGASLRRSTEYAASTQLLLPQTDVVGIAVQQIVAQDLGTELELIRGDLVRENARRRGVHPGRIVVSRVGDARMVEIEATDSTQEGARRAADRYADAYVDVRRAAARDAAEEAIIEVTADIEALGDVSGEEADVASIELGAREAAAILRTRLAQVDVLERLAVPHILEKAEGSTSKKEPSHVGSAFLGLMFGGVLGLTMVALLEGLGAWRMRRSG